MTKILKYEAKILYEEFHKKYPLVKLSDVETRLRVDMHYESLGLDVDTDWEKWFKNKQRTIEYYDSWLD